MEQGTRRDEQLAPTEGLPSPYPSGVAETLSHLANLIDRSIAIRGVGVGVREFAASFLKVPPTAVVASSRHLSTLEFQLTALAFADDLADHPPAAIIGEDQEEPPRWEILDLGELQVSVPFSMAAAFSTGTLAASPLVVFLDDDYERGEFDVTVYARSADAPIARAYLEDLSARSRTRNNPFKGRSLETVDHPKFGPSFQVAKLPNQNRNDVVLPRAIWEQMDRNVHGFFNAIEPLRKAGLALNRGILLDGPPGTGKTALCRVFAGELEVLGVTVIFCDARAIDQNIRFLYRELDNLAPAVVVMEDLDLVLGDRRKEGSRALNDFLLALDGAISSHEGVVTIATTNDIAGIDEAARRPARLDCVVRIPLPDRLQRAEILRRYCRDFGEDLDFERIAGIAEGASGADLRELVSLAVLETTELERRTGRSGALEDLLFRLVREYRFPRVPGLYL